ncbi:katanin p60 ATPase-containing subunit A-like 2 [Bombus affinis]|uniref:katanin p60 ATPase-containing subunit A-like 2 n=1 Tax=Bombus affinis TaxID=309941 RepID=UPI0021B7828B|nr:katanin p60 ATPase-containing subunit A-like 2 [Bombus affinis]
MNGESSLQGTTNKTSHNLRKQEESRTSERNRNILYLICDYLERNGYVDVSDVLIREARLPRKYRVCDNVDLEIILTEYENYYKMKFQNYPILCKEITEEEIKTREMTNANKV